MPQGKGTYGSNVGRPPKKKYQVGGEVEPNFPMENPSVQDANKMGQELKSIPLEEFPISDAMERSENYQLGGAVKPTTAPSISYKEGGKAKRKKGGDTEGIGTSGDWLELKKGGKV